ncbi:TPA: hypothetical protein ACH3X2_006566 [Trebouxia sp. C0005]
MGQKLGRDVSSHSKKESQTPAGNPLPHLIHAELSAAQLGAGRLIVVGDVHGCPDELKILLRKCQFQQGSDVLAFNGDIINKGPKSVQAIDLIQSLGGIVVRGNQDDKALAQYVQWQSGEPLEEKSKWLEELGAERAEWLKQLPFSLSVPCLKLLVVHAGLIPGIPLKEQSLKTLTELRTLPANAFLPDGIADSDSSEPKLDETEVPWASLWKGPQHVVFGHDAGRKLQTWPCATGLDTGCCYGGQLTALVIPSPHKQTNTASMPAQDRSAGCSTCTDQSTVQHSSVQECAQQAEDNLVGSGDVDTIDTGPSLSHNAAGTQAQDSGSVPSLSDLDASLILVPAKKIYSKKKKIKPDL